MSIWILLWLCNNIFFILIMMIYVVSQWPICKLRLCPDTILSRWLFYCLNCSRYFIHLKLSLFLFFLIKIRHIILKCIEVINLANSLCLYAVNMFITDVFIMLLFVLELGLIRELIHTVEFTTESMIWTFRNIVMKGEALFLHWNRVRLRLALF